MKNPFKKQVKKTLEEKLREQEIRLGEYLSQHISFRDRLLRLDKLYPDLISTADSFINKSITLKYDTEIPDEFLCSCQLLGLRIKKMEKVDTFYSDKHKFYMRIEFNDIEETNCDDL